MGRKQFKPCPCPVKKSGKVAGIKNSGGGGVRQPNVKPHKGKTNP